MQIMKSLNEVHSLFVSQV